MDTLLKSTVCLCYNTSLKAKKTIVASYPIHAKKTYKKTNNKTNFLHFELHPYRFDVVTLVIRLAFDANGRGARFAVQGNHLALVPRAPDPGFKRGQRPLFPANRHRVPLGRVRLLAPRQSRRRAPFDCDLLGHLDELVGRKRPLVGVVGVEA